MKYTKNDIQTHSEGYSRTQHPAINVKVYSFTDIHAIAEHFHCSEDQARKAAEFQFESAREQFWEQAEETARYILKQSVKVYSEGRSGGWLTVHDTDSIESWNAVAVARWRKFEKAIRAEIEYLTSQERVFEDIQANEWFRDGSEQYNFIETGTGATVLLPDLKDYLQKHERGYLATA